MQNEKKEFVKGMFIKKHNFQNGGSILKIGIRVDQLNDFLQQFKNQNGFVNVVIAELKQPDDNGYTHYCNIDTFKPKQKDEQPHQRGATIDSFNQQQREYAQAQQTVRSVDDSQEEIPF